MDIAKVQRELAKLDEQIEAERQKFEAATADIRAKRREIEKDYRAFLRRELESLDGAPAKRRGGKIDDEAIIGVLRQTEGEIGAQEIRTGAGIGDESSNALSQRLKSLVDEGRIVKTGERRGTKYRLA
jgi:hypothetical protein